MTRETLTKLAEKQSLKFDECAAFVDAIAAGEVTDSQIAAFLTGLRTKGETVEELAGCVSTLLRLAVKVPHTRPAVFDCCGTGGDGANTFNVSSAAALVIASCGVATAKHGNRAVSSACGSADVFEALGARIDIAPEHSARLLDQIGFCFLFAPLYHPATKRVAQVRRELGFRTIFNLMGPLLNPAGATQQVIGTSSSENAALLASVAAHLPGLRVVSYTNSLGVDELLPRGVNFIHQWNGSAIHRQEMALPTYLNNGFQLNAIKGGDRTANAALLREAISGKASEYTTVTALNAAFGLQVAGKATTLDEGFQLAIDAMKSGAPSRLLDSYISGSQETG